MLTDIENDKDFEKPFNSTYNKSIQLKMEEFKESLRNKDRKIEITDNRKDYYDIE
jgi:hypothetical protein